MFICWKNNQMKLLNDKYFFLSGDYMYCGMIGSHVKPFYLSFFVTGYVLPLCLICLLYVMIVCHLKKHKMPTNPTKNDKNRDRTSHVFKVRCLLHCEIKLKFTTNQDIRHIWNTWKKHAFRFTNDLAWWTHLGPSSIYCNCPSKLFSRQKHWENSVYNDANIYCIRWTYLRSTTWNRY